MKLRSAECVINSLRWWADSQQESQAGVRDTGLTAAPAPGDRRDDDRARLAREDGVAASSGTSTPDDPEVSLLCLAGSR